MTVKTVFVILLTCTIKSQSNEFPISGVLVTYICKLLDLLLPVHSANLFYKNLEQQI